MNILRLISLACFVGLLVACRNASPDVSEADPEGDGFYLHTNGVTVLCPNVEPGSTGQVDGITYTKVTRSELDALLTDDPRHRNSGLVFRFVNKCRSSRQAPSMMRI